MARLCVGIDLGTTYAVVAVCRKGKVDVIANDSGSRTTPSVVGFLDGESFVGEAAKDLPAECQVFDSKRLLGRSANDAVVRKDAADWPFTVAQEGGVLKMQVVGERKSLQPHEVSSMVLKSLKEAAETFLAQPVPCAVITVPPHFTASQRAATEKAGALAGLQVLALLDEPEAAAVAYGLTATPAVSKTVLVLHVGGRSLHAWVRPGSGRGRAASKHADWGGSRFDQRLLEHFQKDIREQHRVALLDAASLAELRAACETAKRKLSSQAEATLSIYLSRHNLKYKATVTRARFEDLCADLYPEVADVMRGAMAAAQVGAVDEVVLVGGSTRMPRIRGMVRDTFSVEPRHSVNPDEAVAHGAALHAAALVGDRPTAGNEVQLKKDPVVRAAPTAASSSGSVSSTTSRGSGGGGGARPKRVGVRKQALQAPPIGIDLGTTYSVVAVCRKGKVDVIANESGSRTTPSVVGFLDGESFVGEAAKDLPAGNRVFDAKRLLGRSWADLDVQKDKKHWPFEVLEQNGVPRIRVSVTNGKEMFAPEEISAMVLRSLKETAENFLGSTVSRAVITVPAYFNERQRQATMDAGKIAGLEVMSIINEPTSAAIAYGLDKKSTAKRTVFIFDLGGGTFDVSVVTIKGNEFTVLASDGDTHLGGQDFDIRLMEHFMKDINSRHGIPQLDKQSAQELREACELAKRKLSVLAETSTTLYFSRYNIRYPLAVTRARFEDLCGDLFKKAMDITRKVVSEAKVRYSAIDEVVLVGGSTRIPKVRAMLTELFGGKELRQSINPDEAVAHGAAVRAAVLGGDQAVSNLVKLRDVTPLSLGVDTLGGRFSVIIPRNSRIPCEKTQRYVTCYDYQSAVSSKIYQGERPLSKDNHCLNKEYRVNVPPRPAGESTVDVTFLIDADGLLTVTCVEPITGARQQLTITRSEAALDADDINAMVQRAERFRREDGEAVDRIVRQLHMLGFSRFD